MMTKEEIRRVAKAHLEKGNVVEAGWTINVLAIMPDEVDETPRDMMRWAFFLGAWHMVQIMGQMQEPTISDAQLESMVEDVQRELARFREEEERKGAVFKAQKAH